MYKCKNIFILFIISFTFISFSSELIDSKIFEEEEEDDFYISENEELISEEEESQEEKNYINPPGFSRISGFYPENFKLKLSSEENTTIYYTDDSTDPRNSSTSKEYKDYILIYDKTPEPNIYSEINTITTYKYHGPNYPIDKAMIIRAVAKNSKGEFSEIKSKTYFITNEDLYKYQDLTVISIVTNPDNLFDPDIGIYVTGRMYIETKKRTNYKMKGKEWERECFVTIFDKGEIVVQQNLGIRIKGTATRIKPGKSFNLYARKKYGKSRIETNLFKDNYDINGNLITSYKSLSLRNIFEENRLRDKFGRDLFYSRKDLTSTNMENSILFLNGEYWGFYLIQEKIDANFISSNYLIPSENIVLAKSNQIEEGPKEVFTDFQQFCRNYSQKDLADEKIYEEIKNYIDIDSMIELFATGIYISHLDWPARNDGEWNNYKEIQEGNIYSNGKWRFIIFDLDYSMGAEFYEVGSADVNNFKNNIDNRSRLKQSYVSLFLGLLKNNTDFQNKFINIYCDYANEVYNIDKVSKLVEKYREEYTDIVAYSLLRWCEKDYESILEGYSYYKLIYLKSLDSIYEFFEQRPKFTFQHMKEFLDLKGDLVYLKIEIKGKGKIQINSITPNFINGAWTGKYFSRIPIKIKAIPDVGYNFKEWTGYFQSIINNIEIILFESQIVTAVFD